MASSQPAEIIGWWIEKQKAWPRLRAISYYLPFLCLAAYCVVGAASVTMAGVRMMHNNWENTHPEGPHIYIAIQAARTGHLYFPFTQSPYVIQSYGPLYYAINAVIAKASHLDVVATVLHARLVSFICYLLCGVLVFAISRRMGTSVLLSALAACMMLGHPDFLAWNATARPDMLFITAMLASLYFAVRAGADNRSCYAIAGCLAGLAFLIKQPGIAAAIAIFGVLFLRKEYRKAFLFAVCAAIPVLATVGFLLWHEPFFLQQFTSVGKGYWSLLEGIHFAFMNLIQVDRLVPLCIGALGFVGAVKRGEKEQMIAWFAAINWIVELSGLPQLGSGINYFMPGWAGCALLLPAAILMVQEYMRLPVVATATSGLFIWALMGGLTSKIHVENFYLAPRNMSYAALRPYRIISDLSLVSLYGHDPDLLDTFAVHSLELKGRWSSDPVVENIRQDKYDLILLQRVNFKRTISYYRGMSDYAPSVVTALNENYVVLCNTLWSMVLRPRTREVNLPPSYFSDVFGQRCGTGNVNKAPNLLIDPKAKLE